MIDFTSLNEVLAWLAGPAGVAAWAVLVSDAFRGWKAEGKLTNVSALGMQALVTGTTLVLPTLAYAALNVIPPATLALLQPYYGFVASLFIGLLAQKGWYLLKTSNQTPKLPPVVNNVPAAGDVKYPGEVG